MYLDLICESEASVFFNFLNQSFNPASFINFFLKALNFLIFRIRLDFNFVHTPFC